MKIIILILLSSSLAFAGNRTDEANDFIGGSNININFEEHKQILNGFVKDIPWEGSYWPNRAASIAYRHEGKGFLSFYFSMLKGVKLNLKSLKRKVKRNSEKFSLLTSEEISKLSAAEKYDLLLGDSNFSFTKNIFDKVEENHERWKGTTWWTGICHGWAPASIKYKTPLVDKTYTNSFGQKITFSTEDLKGLASFFVASSTADKKPIFFGNRCNQKKPSQDRDDHNVLELANYTRVSDECLDISAANFHNILINKIGIQKKSFIVDVDYNAPVNNHPIAGYKMEILSSSATKVKLHTKVYYVDWTKPGESKMSLDVDDRFLVKNYYYTLFLDQASNIESSQWNNTKSDVWAPDFMWFYPEDTTFSEYYNRVTDTLNFSSYETISTALQTEALKSSKNKMLRNYLSRLRSKKSRKKGVFRRASRFARKEGIKLLETRKYFEAELDRYEVTKEAANPQLVRVIMDELLK